MVFGKVLALLLEESIVGGALFVDSYFLGFV
jgi:hypothetical protein